LVIAKVIKLLCICNNYATILTTLSNISLIIDDESTNNTRNPSAQRENANDEERTTTLIQNSKGRKYDTK